MEQKVEIKQEPTWLEGTAGTSFENFELESADLHLKEETKPELTEPGPTQPAAEIKNEIIKEEQTVDELDPLLKEEDRSPEDLNVHDLPVLSGGKLVHTGDKLHHCTSYRKKFQRDEHAINRTCRRPHICSICGKTFPYKSHLLTHNLVHTGERKHSCDLCGKTFSLKCNLKKHILVHTGERPHSCILCGKSFYHKTHLKDHMLVHTQERPHRCDTCGWKFTQKSHLKTHIALHTGEKAYRCNHCAKAFSQTSHLKRHSCSHARDRRPY